MTTITRIIGVVVAAFAAATLTIVLFVFISMPFQRFESHPTVYYSMGAVEGLARGFTFVFIGSMVADRRWRGIAAWSLVLLGIGAYIYDHASYSSSPELPVWHLSSCIAGGLLAAAIRAWRMGGQPSAAPNGGPAASVDNSNPPCGPPSVS